ncbi:hypothetical protein Skr01_56940 [Sphaerisporangium krabiense]|nr:hypothetical protein Skr01_56940 [Sphaerisporangium krabiense]
MLIAGAALSAAVPSALAAIGAHTPGARAAAAVNAPAIHSAPATCGDPARNILVATGTATTYSDAPFNIIID